MGSHSYITRSKAKRRRNDVTVSEDRISNLPDEVIGHILSFLPTKKIVQMSVLSSRWRFLWTSMTKFYFNELDLLDYRTLFNENNRYEEVLGIFGSFVDNVISLCDALKSIHEFKLNCQQFWNLSCINAWIHFAVSRNVNKLSLCVEAFDTCTEAYIFSPSTPLPKCSLTCNSLVVLKLNSRFDVEIPTSIVSFPHLKELHLHGVYPADLQVTQKLLYMCPVLEDLKLVGQLAHDKAISFKILMPTLKRLIIHLLVDKFGVHKHRVMISTRNLQQLEIVDETVAQFVIRPLSPKKAIIDVGDYLVFYADHELIDAVCHAYLLLAGVAKAEFLSVSANTMAEPTKDEYDDIDIDIEPVWIPPKSVPHCLSVHLKMIHIQNLDGRRDQLELVKYLLKKVKF
ncbi:hypothetical protein Ancab_031393 [Ancistrocladus abbreviatus]